MIIHVRDTEPVKLNSPYRNEYAEDYKFLATSKDIYGINVGVYGKTKEIAVMNLLARLKSSENRKARFAKND
jgi:hypothetical protein